MTYLALGDSYTIGEGIPPSHSWPLLLSKALQENGLKFANPEIIATTGWTTTDLLEALARTTLQPPYDLVSLLIGVNNQYQSLSIGQFKHEFQILLKLAIKWAGNQPKNVLVLSIPDWGVSPFAASKNRAAIAQQINRFNHIKKTETLKQSVPFIDITTLSRQAFNQSNFFVSDGLHFSGLMYQLWVEAIMQSKFFKL